MRAGAHRHTLKPAWKPAHSGSGSERTVFHGLAFSPIEEVPLMKWETPQACDTRFGFEITMYISTR